jgi:hypothetical protein
LGQDQLYIIDSDVDAIVLTSPVGLIKVTKDAGPLKIRGKFVDGTGANETRTYKGKAVFTLEPIGTGKAEVIIIPAGALLETDVIRKTLDVTGAGPPTPPDPPSPTDPFVATLQAAYALDTDTDKAASIADLAGVFGAAAKLSSSPNFATLQGVLTWIKGSESIASTAIPKTRAAITAELNKVLPKPSLDPLTDAQRALLAKTFQRVADALSNLK